MNKTFVFILLCLSAISSWAQSSSRDEIYADFRRSGYNYCAYPEPENVVYTKPPKGYKPFYISTYARHGSRYHSDSVGYTVPYYTMRKAHEHGVLTPLGEHVYQVTDSVYRLSIHRIGDLTRLGALQHQGIARRMVHNYPEVFRGDVHVEAHSTPVVRSVLSMLNECVTLKALCPHLTLNSDASYADYYYLNEENPTIKKYQDKRKIDAVSCKLEQELIRPERLMSVLFTDSAYVHRHVKCHLLMYRLLGLAGILQNQDVDQTRGGFFDLYSIFTPEEIYDIWKYNNFRWFLKMGFNSYTSYAMPYYKVHTLLNIIHTADTCLAQSKSHNVTLRFGHDIVVMPIASLLHLGSFGVHTDNPDVVAEQWKTYEITPMATNLQFIFYRSKNKPDLVKVLLNEREMKMPIKSDIAPYYKWQDFRAYCMNLISKTPK